MPERIKAALRSVGLSVKAIAESWGVDRSGLSDRIHDERLSEGELVRLAAETHTTPAYLRYGLLGDYHTGFADALAAMERSLRDLRPEAPRSGPTKERPRMQTRSRSEVEAERAAEARRREEGA